MDKMTIIVDIWMIMLFHTTIIPSLLIVMHIALKASILICISLILLILVSLIVFSIWLSTLSVTIVTHATKILRITFLGMRRVQSWRTLMMLILNLLHGLIWFNIYRIILIRDFISRWSKLRSVRSEYILIRMVSALLRHVRKMLHLRLSWINPLIVIIVIVSIILVVVVHSSFLVLVVIFLFLLTILSVRIVWITFIGLPISLCCLIIH